MKTSIILVVVILVSRMGFAATLRVPSQYANIQLAINASSNGDTILVAPGTYEALVGNDIIAKSIHILSESGPKVTWIANVELDPYTRSGSYAFDIRSAPGPCTISGFTMWGHLPGDMGSNYFTIRVHDSDVKIVGNRFIDNYQGSVIDVEGSSSTMIEYNLFSRNMATSIQMEDGSSSTIQWNTFSGNTWYEDIWLLGSTCHAEIRYNIIVNGLCMEPPPYCDSYGVEIDSPAENVVFECNDVWNNPSGNYRGTLLDQTGINGNISMDPLFCGTVGSGNFYLQSSSPCAEQNVPSACSGQGMGCYPATCTVAVKQQSWGLMKSLFDNKKK